MHSSPTTELLEPEEGFRLVIEAFRRQHPESDTGRLERAYRLAFEAHDGQTRKSGEPYITHPIAVTQILVDYGMDEPTLAAAFLHDTVEDTDVTLEQITTEFGNEIAYLIDGVTKLDRLQYGTREQAQAATIRKMVIAMAEDLRVLIIKLCDRLHNIRTSAALSPEKQERVARETLDVYAPLAHRLGVQEIKHELEDRCFQILYPGPYNEITDQLNIRAPQREVYIEKVITELRGMLDESHIEASVSGRPKHHYSIYRKMVEQSRTFDDIHDLMGVRVITDTIQDCYGVLGLVHARWLPVSGRFKDFVAMPKFNLYQSLHTTVIGPDGKALEIQIRTREMDQIAEAGVAAHWRYKETEKTDLRWKGKLHSLEDGPSDPMEFLDHLKMDLYQDEVFVTTPAGDIKTLPKGANAIDFAYAVHTEVGHRCVGAKINKRLMPLSTTLESGDSIEVITSRAEDAGPSRDWLKVVKTSRARSKIKQWFLKERRSQALADGREQLFALLRKEGLGLSASQRDALLDEVAHEFSKPDGDVLLVAIGEGELGANGVLQRMVRIVRPEEDTDDLLAPVKPRRYSSAGPGVIVEGLSDMMVSIARCCVPVPGDPIVGFVTVGRGVSVHRSDCTNLSSLLANGSERMVDVSWPADRVGTFTVWVQVEALDRTRLLRDVTDVISEFAGNITASSSITGRDRVAILRYEVELSDPSQVPHLINDLRGVDGVFASFRLVGEPDL